jgi:hypothetical protein
MPSREQKNPGQASGPTGVFYLHGCTGRYLLLQYLHFHHPWRSYAARKWIPRTTAWMQEVDNVGNTLSSGEVHERSSSPPTIWVGILAQALPPPLMPAHFFEVNNQSTSIKSMVTDMYGERYYTRKAVTCVQIMSLLLYSHLKLIDQVYHPRQEVPGCANGSSHRQGLQPV